MIDVVVEDGAEGWLAEEKSVVAAVQEERLPLTLSWRDAGDLGHGIACPTENGSLSYGRVQVKTQSYVRRGSATVMIL